MYMFIFNTANYFFGFSYPYVSNSFDNFLKNILIYDLLKEIWVQKLILRAALKFERFFIHIKRIVHYNKF